MVGVALEISAGKGTRSVARGYWQSLRRSVLIVRGVCQTTVARALAGAVTRFPPLQRPPLAPIEHIATIAPPSSATSLGPRYQARYARSGGILRRACGRLRCGPWRRSSTLHLRTNGKGPPRFRSPCSRRQLLWGVWSVNHSRSASLCHVARASASGAIRAFL